MSRTALAMPDPDVPADPQECPDCVVAADLCAYHRGWADGWDQLAAVVGVFAQRDAHQHSAPDTLAVLATAHLDDVLDAALSAHAGDPADTRPVGEVVRAVLADPTDRPVVDAWLSAAGDSPAPNRVVGR